MRRLFAATAAALLLSATAPLGASASAVGTRPLPGAVFAQPSFPPFRGAGRCKDGRRGCSSATTPATVASTPPNRRSRRRTSRACKWPGTINRSFNRAGIVVDGGVAYITDVNQTNEGLYALDAASGKQKWYTPLGLNSVGSTGHAVSAVSGNVVISACTNQDPSNLQSGLCGFNAKSGKTAWSYMCTPYPPSKNGPCAGIQQGSAPAVSGKLVYAQIVQGCQRAARHRSAQHPDGRCRVGRPGRLSLPRRRCGLRLRVHRLRTAMCMPSSHARARKALPSCAR